MVVYFKGNNGTLQHKSYCILSNDNAHDVAMVYKVQQLIINDIKQNYKDIDEVIYFSDGCAVQYKNRYNLYNLCQHKDDFDMQNGFSLQQVTGNSHVMVLEEQ